MLHTTEQSENIAKIRLVTDSAVRSEWNIKMLFLRIIMLPALLFINSIMTLSSEADEMEKIYRDFLQHAHQSTNSNLSMAHFEEVVTFTSCGAIQTLRFRSESFEVEDISDDIKLFLDAAVAYHDYYGSSQESWLTVLELNEKLAYMYEKGSGFEQHEQYCKLVLKPHILNSAK